MRKISSRDAVVLVAGLFALFGSLLVRPAISAEGTYIPLPPPKEGTLTWDLEQGTSYWTLGGKKYTSPVRVCTDRRYIEEIQKALVDNKKYLKRAVELSGQVAARLVSENKCRVSQAPVEYTVVEITATDHVINISPDPALNRKRKLGVAEIKIEGSPNLFMSVMLPHDIGFSI